MLDIQTAMHFALGFFTAAILAVMFIPLVHKRAVRLTRRNVEAAMPLTVAEVRADKDQLRAGFAMTTRRLEMSVARMKEITTAKLADLGKKTDALNALKKELGEKTGTIGKLQEQLDEKITAVSLLKKQVGERTNAALQLEEALGNRTTALGRLEKEFDENAARLIALEDADKKWRQRVDAAETRLGRVTEALQIAERKCSEKEAELVELIAELGEQSAARDNQRAELESLRSQVEDIMLSVAEYEQALQEPHHLA